MPVDWFGFVYAATVGAGGVMGYVKAGELEDPIAKYRYKLYCATSCICRFHSLAGSWLGLWSLAQLWRLPEFPGNSAPTAPTGHVPVPGRINGRQVEPFRQTDARRHGLYAVRGRFGQECGHLQSVYPALASKEYLKPSDIRNFQNAGLAWRFFYLISSFTQQC